MRGKKEDDTEIASDIVDIRKILVMELTTHYPKVWYIGILNILN